MDLKNIHLGFIAISVLLCLGCGAWFLATPAGKALAHSTVLGIVCLVGGALLSIYAVAYVRKIQRLESKP